MSESFDSFIARLAEDLPYAQIGTQEFTGSELFICDPMDQAKAPISEAIAPGRYPLYLVHKNWAHHKTVEATPHNARYELWFKDEKPTQWEQLFDDGYDEFSAEYGSMAFLDKRIMDCLTPINEKQELFENYLSPQAYNGHTPLPYAELELDRDHRFFVVVTGRGNGMYCAFAGRDWAGNLLRISVDFEM